MGVGETGFLFWVILPGHDGMGEGRLGSCFGLFRLDTMGWERGN